MKRKIEDQMAMLAFGELSAEEAARLQARTQVDPEAAEAYGAYSRMKGELSLLHEVPADQLSTERLRAAILARGLKEHQPRREKPTWLWMPAAAALVAFGLMYAKGLNRVAPVSTAVVLNDSVKASLPGLPSFKIERPPVGLNAGTGLDIPSDTDAERPVMVVASNARSERRHRDVTDFVGSRGGNAVISTEGTGESIANASQEHSGAGESAFDSAMKKEPAPAVAVAPSGPARPIVNDSSNPTIVVIQPETDASTGTHKATEVQNSTNVLVGG